MTDGQDNAGYFEVYNELENQRQLLKKLISSLQENNRQLARAERKYRMELSKKMLELKVDGFVGEVDGREMATEPVAWTKTSELARGIPEIAELREKRDILKGEKEATMQKIYETKMHIQFLEAELEAIRKGE